MRFIDEYREGDYTKGLIDNIHSVSKRKVRLMEVCGTHTVAIFKSGIRDILPPTIRLISGPGCPVCVTPVSDIDRAIAIARQRDVIFTTFGDMMRVPGLQGSLQKKKAEEGLDIRVVYSPLDALRLARENRDKNIAFFSAGFETTTPTIAATIFQAYMDGLKNFFILPVNKTVPPAIRALLDTPEIGLDGFICPGHVSVLIGSNAYRFIAEDYKKPAVISGFEPIDILLSIYMLVKQIEAKDARIEIEYKRAVTPEGNKKAMGIMWDVFEPADAEWRGIGVIPESGLKLTKKYKAFDAVEHFGISIEEVEDKASCNCGDVLRGLKEPPECGLFGKACTPENPVGPCMVSTEGSCSAYYRFGANG
ncbi:MAG: hydrogenase formation protein HypD [Nitrospirota bacterium]